MNLRELLDELSTNLLRDRSKLVAGPTDRLWKDADLVRYINDAYRRFARHTLLIRDYTTPEVVQVTLEEDKFRYVLHESILSVMSARYNTDTVDLTRINHGAIRGVRQPDDFIEGVGWNPTPQAGTGRPYGWWTEEEVDTENPGRLPATLYLDRTPTADEEGNIVYVRVCRLPLCDLTTENMKAVPEIPEDYHFDILDWAAYRALRNDDVDAVRKRADEHRAAFEKCMTDARNESLRKMHTQVGWKFGVNGFNWTGNNG